MLEITHHIRLDPEVTSLLREHNSKLDHITERLKHMATDAQVAQLKTDIAALINAYTAAIAAAVAKAQAQSPDPAIDDLDNTVKAATAALTAGAADPAVAVPVTPPAAT